MKAIIETGIESNGPVVYMIGIGNTEQEARQSAFAHVNHGGNDFEEEYTEGTLVDADPEIASFYEAGYPLCLTMSDGLLVINWEVYKNAKGYSDQQLSDAKKIMLGVDD